MKVQVNLCKSKQSRDRVKTDVTVARRHPAAVPVDEVPVIRIPVRPVNRVRVVPQPVEIPETSDTGIFDADVFAEIFPDVSVSPYGDPGTSDSSFDDIFSGVATHYRPGIEPEEETEEIAPEEPSDDIFSILDDIELIDEDEEDETDVPEEEPSDDIFSILDDIVIGGDEEDETAEIVAVLDDEDTEEADEAFAADEPIEEDEEAAEADEPDEEDEEAAEADEPVEEDEEAAEEADEPVEEDEEAAEEADEPVEEDEEAAEEADEPVEEAEEETADSDEEELDDEELLRRMIEEEEAALAAAAAEKAAEATDSEAAAEGESEDAPAEEEGISEEEAADAVEEVVPDEKPAEVFGSRDAAETARSIFRETQVSDFGFAPEDAVSSIADDSDLEDGIYYYPAPAYDDSRSASDADGAGISIRFFDRSDNGQRMEVADESQASGQEVAFYDSSSGKLSRVCGIIRKGGRKDGADCEVGAPADLFDDLPDDVISDDGANRGNK